MASEAAVTSAPTVVATRVICWTAGGYDDSFTQYQIMSDGSVWICQIACRDNLARALQGVPSRQAYGSVDRAMEVVALLVENRVEDGAAYEATL